MSGAPLFDQRPPFDRERLARRLAELSRENIFIGTSSWKYEGWCGQIYTRERYMARGAFSRRTFEKRCLREYAETFPVAGGDFSFYRFPPPGYWPELFAGAPPGLRLALKVPEEITINVFPKHTRYGARAGSENPSYLNATLLEEALLHPLEPFGDRLCPFIFEFGAFPRYVYRDVIEFVRDLDRFLAALPRRYRYCVEVRNAEFLAPAYFDCLRSHGVAHVFNAWTHMPELASQIRIREAFTAGFTVCRVLLRRGRPYETAVQMFSPYEEIRDPNPEGRAAVRDLIDYARIEGIAAFIFVNNRFEGNAPRTIEAIVGL